jgi:hypothetical protein
MTLRAIIICAVSTEEQAEDDKESMEQQERDGLAFCESEGYDVVDIIRIPGYSRSFFTLQELVEAASADGEYGPAKLQAHIYRCDFDLMWCRITNRFNREQSLNAEIIGRIVRKCGAQIHSDRDGRIHLGNYRGLTAITGYRDATEVDELVRRRAEGIVGTAKRGLPVNGTPPMSHRYVINPKTGDKERVVLREEYTALWNDLARLLLEGIPYRHLEDELYLRWGYTDQQGQPYFHSRFFRLLNSPMFWGNNVIRRKGKARSKEYGIWAFDPSVPAPNGVEMYWNTHDPVYTGELAEQVKAEMRRRTQILNGTQTRFGTNRFAGLLFCDDCHSVMSYERIKNHGKAYVYLACRSVRDGKYRRTPCDNRRAMREERVQEWIDKRLRQWVDAELVTFEDTPQKPKPDDTLKLRAAVDKLQIKLNRFIAELIEADDDLKGDFRLQIRAVKDELTRAQAQLENAQQRQQEREVAQQSQHLTLMLIKQMGLSAFWQQPPLAVNQQLKALFGTMRLAVDDRTILGFVARTRIKPRRG